MGFFEQLSESLSKTRQRFTEGLNVLLERGPALDAAFWDELEEVLILGDVGFKAADTIVSELKDYSTRKALPDASAVLDRLKVQIAETFTSGGEGIFDESPAVLLFVGVNGTGKTTTVGKIAKQASEAGRKVILGSADTYRAAAIEQLQIWADRAEVELVSRERGSDAAGVCYDTIERAEKLGCDMILLDTAGRLHTSSDLMRELRKVVSVVRKRSAYPVYILLVIDATTGQNAMNQARQFNDELKLDALVVTKLDGTAKGGIALAVSCELELPVVKIGIGEGIDDLKDFDALQFASALVGEFEADKFV